MHPEVWTLGDSLESYERWSYWSQNSQWLFQCSYVDVWTFVVKWQSTSALLSPPTDKDDSEVEHFRCHWWTAVPLRTIMDSLSFPLVQFFFQVFYLNCVVLSGGQNFSDSCRPTKSLAASPWMNWYETSRRSFACAGIEWSCTGSHSQRMAASEYLSGLYGSICHGWWLDDYGLRPSAWEILWRILEGNNQELVLHSKYGLHGCMSYPSSPKYYYWFK